MKTRLVIGNKNYSSWSLRPWLLLREAGIDFEEHRIPLDLPDTKHEPSESGILDTPKKNRLQRGAAFNHSLVTIAGPTRTISRTIYRT